MVKQIQDKATKKAKTYHEYGLNNLIKKNVTFSKPYSDASQKIISVPVPDSRS